MESCIEKYITWAVIELATNSEIDHRNYSQVHQESLLKKLTENHGSIDKAIKAVAIETIPDIIDMYEGFKKTLNEFDVDVGVDEITDYVDEFSEDLFSKFVGMCGLYEIFNLHGDDEQKFREKFIKMCVSLGQIDTQFEMFTKLM